LLRSEGKRDLMARPRRGQEDIKIIKNALRIKDLESTDPVYLAHRAKRLGKKEGDHDR